MKITKILKTPDLEVTSKSNLSMAEMLEAHLALVAKRNKARVDAAITAMGPRYVCHQANLVKRINNHAVLGK
jgi:hypothetical protein